MDATQSGKNGITSTFNPDTGIATVTMAMEGKANKINAAFGEGLSSAMDAALASPGIKGIIITSGHRDFCVGGDIDGLYAADDAAFFLSGVRQLDALFRRIETCGFPVVAALNGSALGGGYELALSCHHRIVIDDPKVQVGLPEVTLGLMPGAGGTQRLPRLIGIQAALEMIVQGKLVRAPKAKGAGLVDDVASNVAELHLRAEAWIQANPKARQPWDRPDFAWPAPAPSSNDARALFMGACAMLYKKTAGAMIAPQEIISVVQEGARVTFDRALEVEARAFTRLALSPQAKDMIRTIWYHRTAAEKHIGLPSTKDAGIKKITILGAGMMGAGLAYVCASRGYQVVLKDISAAALEKGMAHCRAQVAERDRHRPEADRDALLARITGSLELEAIRGSDLVIEAVVEDIALKHRVIREVEPLLAAGAIFASNTSALPITDLATASAYPERFIGLHYFSPVEVMPLVEIIRGKLTDDDTLARALAFTRVIGKLPIVVNDGYGFFTTRVFSSYILEGAQLVADGHDPILVEWAARVAGMAVPPLQVFDEVSMRLARHGMEQARRYRPESQDLGALRVVRRMVDEFDRPGRVEGKGFYVYENGKRVGLWPGLTQLAEGTPAQTGVPYLVNRLLYAQAAEVGRTVHEGVLRARRDAEVGAIFGIGFAPGTGGPLSWMDRRGLATVVADLDALALACGPRYLPAPVLREMAEKSERFFPLGVAPG